MARPEEYPVSYGNRKGRWRVPLRHQREKPMLKGGILWLIGIPLPIIILLWLFGYLS